MSKHDIFNIRNGVWPSSPFLMFYSDLFVYYSIIVLEINSLIHNLEIRQNIHNSFTSIGIILNLNLWSVFSYRDSFLHNVHIYINERDSEATSLTNFSLSSPLSLTINFTLSSSNILFLARFSNTEKEKVWLELDGRIYFLCCKKLQIL